MLIEAGKVEDIAPDGMKRVKAGDKEIVVCRVGDDFYAVQRRCGHMNAPLEKGNLDGTYLTCPFHHVQFDIITGEALNYPIPEGGLDPPPKRNVPWTKHIAALMDAIRIEDLKTYPVRVEAGVIKVEV
jgi:nitrite reductase/ring-hydroxylating ferredoxin subunit